MVSYVKMFSNAPLLQLLTLLCLHFMNSITMVVTATTPIITIIILITAITAMNELVSSERVVLVTVCMGVCANNCEGGEVVPLFNAVLITTVSVCGTKFFNHCVLNS